MLLRDINIMIGLALVLSGLHSGCSRDDAPASRLRVSRQAVADEAVASTDATANSRDGGQDLPVKRADQLTTLDRVGVIDSHPPLEFKQPEVRGKLFRGLGQVVLPPGQEEAKAKEKDVPPRLFTTPTSPLGGAEYQRRADSYLRRWNEEKEKYAAMTAQQQEEAKAQLKRNVIGE